FYIFSFFFQAEDGIRDRNVTGVQTCALPIYHFEPGRGRDLVRSGDEDVQEHARKLVCAQRRAKVRFWTSDPLACAMPTVHCHLCGGFIANPAGTTYRAPDPSAPSAAVPHSALCACEHAVVYGIAPA